jgi:hypothetical protein
MRTWLIGLVTLGIGGGLAVGVALAQLPYGPDTCEQGFVWREAFPGDHVCVRPEVRAQTAADNAEANARRQPGGGPYGPDTCRPGFVWRDARPGDHVCVTPATREQAATDNRLAGNRRAGASGDEFTYDKPRYMDDRLDWCLTWGTNCGRPVAVTFCNRRRFEDAVDFGPDKVGRSAQTRLTGSNQICNGDFCTAFSHITCRGRINRGRVFANPVWKEHRLDVCLQWATNCGKPAADAFCKAKGFTESMSDVPDLEPGYATTRVIGTDQICDGNFCKGFQQIICR